MCINIVIIDTEERIGYLATFILRNGCIVNKL